MKTIGLLGGMSWESTQSYYQIINRGINQRLGGLHSAKIMLYSVDFAQIEVLQHQGNWQGTADILIEAAKAIEAGGADFLLICTNTMHKVAEQIESHIAIPLLHIADATGEQLKQDKITRVGLLGTRFTMTEAFYKTRLTDKFAIEVVVPDDVDQTLIHEVIYQELCLGIINENSRSAYLSIIEKLYQQGAQAVILGCTEIALLVQQDQTTVPLYDTVTIHAASAVDAALS